MIVHPVRLQLSRRRGFDLQKMSLAYNGLPAVNCTRAGRWGNPFVVCTKYKPGTRCGGFYIAVPTVEDAVGCFEEWLSLPEQAEYVTAAIVELRGKNLACYCKPAGPCHCDVWLRIVNN